MSTISQNLSGFIYNGAPLALASAAFKGNLNIVYGFNASGTGYTSFKPTSTFNSLTQLQQDGVYTVDAKTPGFAIPGATLTASSAPGSGKMELVTFNESRQTSQTRIAFMLTNTDNSYIAFVAVIDNLEVYSVSGGTGPGEHEMYVPFLAAGVHTLKIVDSSGNILKHDFTVN